MTGSEKDGKKKEVKCKNCKRSFKLFLAHLKKVKSCQESYGDEYERMVKQKVEEKSEYLKNYKDKNKKQIQPQRANYRIRNKKSISQKHQEYESSNRNLLTQKKKIHRQKKKMEMTSKHRILAFRREIIDGPNFTCYSCNRRLFKGQVKILQTENISKLKATMEKKFLRRIGLQWRRKELIFCYNCLTLIKKSKIPRIHVSNGLWLDPVPDELLLKDLEQQLIARSLLFMKVKKLPTTRMKALKDKVISVPLEEDDISKNISKIALPRHPDDAKIVAVQLKRKLQMKNSHLEEYIRPAKCIKAIQKLQELGNPFYQNVQINEHFMEKDEVSK